MDNELLCNFKKCRQPLSSHAWVTSCSHIFCNDDGTREFKKAFKCPACSTSLSGNYDIVKVDLNPTEQYKSMVLAGQRPEVIFEVCSRAVAFWTYQVHQEIMFQKYVAEKAKQTSSQLDKHYQDVLQRAKNEILCTQKELERFHKKTAELSEKLTERIRQYQKLQSLYEALKRKCISPSYFERQTNQDKLQERTNVPLVMATASEILHPHMQKSKRTLYKETEKEFVLRPAYTPSDDIEAEPAFPNLGSFDEMNCSQDRRNIPPKRTRK